MLDFQNFTPQDRVLPDDELAKMMTVICLAQGKQGSCSPKDVEFEYLRAQNKIREYRRSPQP